MWALGRLAGPVCGYNLTFLLGYVTSGLGMWALVRHLVPSRIVASVAAVLFAFTSFSQLKTEWGHAAGVFLGLFPLLVLTIVRLWKRVTVGRVIVTGIVWGCLPYVDGYYLTFAALTVLGLVGGMSLSIVRRRGRDAVSSIVGRLVATAAAGGVALVVLLPWALVLLSDFGAIDEQTTRTGDDAGRYSARLWEFLLPSGRHPLAPDAYANWRIENMHRSNLAETALYVGIVPIVLAVIGVVAIPSTGSSELDRGRHRPRRNRMLLDRRRSTNDQRRSDRPRGRRCGVQPESRRRTVRGADAHAVGADPSRACRRCACCRVW